MLPNDTALARFVRDFGDSVLSVMTEHLYQSPIVSLLFYLSGVAMLIYTAISIHRGQLSKYVTTFWIGWLLVQPINKKPAVYTIVNTITSNVALELQVITHKLMTNFGTNSTLPPNFVFNSIIRASSMKLQNPIIRKDVRFIIDNCIPNAPNKQGKPISAADLFTGKYSSEPNGTDSIVFNFDPKYLRVRTFKVGNETINCMDLLTSTIGRIRSEIKNYDPTKLPEALYVGLNTGQQLSKGNEVTTWNTDGSSDAYRVGKMAMNLAQANVIQDIILDEYYETKGAKYEGDDDSTADTPLVRLIKNPTDSTFDSTKIALNIMNAPTAIARYINIDGKLNSASALYNINKKMLDLPYYISFIQSILKLICPLLALTILFGTWRPLTIWTSVWFLSMAVPWILFISRIITNSILLWSFKIENLSQNMNLYPGFLEMGIDFTAANNMLNDTARAMAVFLQAELGLWGALFLVIPAAGWIAGGKMNNWTHSAGSAVAGMAGRKVTNKAIDKVGEQIKKGSSASLGYAAPKLRAATRVPLLIGKTIKSTGTSFANKLK